MNDRPRIGLILLQAEWFDSVVALPELAQSVARDSKMIVDYLSDCLEIIETWQVNSAGSLDDCCLQLPAADIDLVVLCFQVWAEDFYIQPLVRALGSRPLAVWCFVPSSKPPQPASFTDVLRYSGTVGTFEGMGTLRNLGVDYLFTAGSLDDSKVVNELHIYGRAARIQRLLQRARFGLLPARNEQMQSTFVDEFRLMAEIGPQVEYISVNQLAQAASQIPQDEVDDYIEYLKKSCRIEDVSPATLEKGVRASLGLAHLAIDKRLDVLSINDISPELHRVMGLRPCLYPPVLTEAGILLGLEGDLGAATALFILERLCASPCLFIEFWYWNEEEDWLVGGHAGVQNPAAAPAGGVSITRDFEYAQSDACEGAHFQFIASPGCVTLFQLRCTPDGWQAIAAAGESLAGAQRLEGYPHAAIRFDVPVMQFLHQSAQVGTTQHFIMAYGNVLPEIDILCKLLHIPLQRIC